MATSTANGSAHPDGNAISSKSTGPKSQQARSSYNGKNADGGRKPLGGHDDSSQRRPPIKAWESGQNPVTQRAYTPSQSNGAVTQAKPTTQKSTSNQETNTPDKHASDRLTYLMGIILGLPVTITLKNGESFGGIFAGTQLDGPETSYLLKMVQQVGAHPKAQTNGFTEPVIEYIGLAPDHSMTFGAVDVADIAVDNVPDAACIVSQDVTSSSFRIDSDISGNLASRERNLQRWEAPQDTGADMSLESGGEWDQFKANEQRFGVTSDYDENIYTTRIDKSHPLHRMREAEAERIAREIEGDTSTNAHIREERGIRHDDDGIDEEERYSGVRRNGHDFPLLQSNQSNKYTPPARRPLTTGRGPIGNGSPLDPAIISSQIARSSSKTQEVQTTDVTQAAKPIEPSEAQKTPVPNLPRHNPVAKDVSSKPALPAVAGKAGGLGVNATENVETELLDSFRQFANLEKMRVQDSRRNRASADKAIRLNDLMKFSKNFKLLTPVPKDLVPILAKDKSKQEEIMEKAQRNADQHGSVPGKLAISTDQKTQRPLAAAQWIVDPVASSGDVQHNGRGRQGVSSGSAQASQASKDRHLPQAPSNQSSKSGRGLLSHRLEDTHRMHKAAIHVTVPAPLPIQDARVQPSRPSAQASSSSSPQKASGVRSPTSAVSAKFNVRAMEFKPNPAASTFKPVTDPSDASSPKSGADTRSISRAPSPSVFFGDRKPLPPSERPSITAHFNPLKFLKAEAEKEKKTKEYASNGGIKPAFKTPPTWNPPKDGEDFKSYKDMFDAVRPSANGTTLQNAPPGNPPMAHQHQLPLHLQTGPQGIPQVQVAQQVIHNPQSQPHHYSNNLHYDDHHMRHSASQTSAYPSPSPRMNYMNLAAYPSPMGQHAQLAYGQQMPQYFLGPHGPQPAGLRQYSGGPQMIAAPGPHLAAQMMVQQPSGGGIMGMQQPMVAFNPQFAMYNGVPPSFAGPPQPPSGYPSPGRGAPMMMHQGSHQGQHSQMYMAPNHGGQAMYAQHQPAHMTPLRGYASPPPPYSQVNQSPYQQHQYPHQAHRTPSNGYAQLSQTHHQHMASQQVLPQAPPMDSGEGPK